MDEKKEEEENNWRREINGDVDNNNDTQVNIVQSAFLIQGSKIKKNRVL